MEVGKKCPYIYLLRPVLSTAIELLATQRHVGILKQGYKDGQIVIFVRPKHRLFCY
jgi:hypothetical protein